MQGRRVYAYSVHDDVQIASLKNYGTIYATQHYINGHVVYCLEHTMNSPGIRNNSDGPYKVVDLAQYAADGGLFRHHIQRKDDARHRLGAAAHVSVHGALTVMRMNV